MEALSWIAVIVLALAGIYIIRLLFNGYINKAMYYGLVDVDQLKKIDIEHTSVTIIKKQNKFDAKNSIKIIDYNYIFGDKKEEVFGLVLFISYADMTRYIGVIPEISESNSHNNTFLLKQYKYGIGKDGRIELTELNSINGFIEEKQININHLRNYVNGDKVVLALLNEMLK